MVWVTVWIMHTGVVLLLAARKMGRVSLKKIRQIPHHRPVCILCISLRLCKLQYCLLCEFTSPEKRIIWGLLSPPRADRKSQLQKFTLSHIRRWQSFHCCFLMWLQFRSFVAVCADSFEIVVFCEGIWGIFENTVQAWCQLHPVALQWAFIVLHSPAPPPPH
jgi:hypothetical protein